MGTMIATFKNGEVKELTTTSELQTIDKENVLYFKAVETTELQQQDIANYFDLNIETFRKREDIEISSHYIENHNQLTLNLSIPINISGKISEEESIHVVLKDNKIFFFLPRTISNMLDKLIKLRYDVSSLEFSSNLDILAFQIGRFADYYADLVELDSKRIRNTYYATINSTKASDDVLDLLSIYNFNNFLLRESVSEFQRITLLLRKKYTDNKKLSKKLDLELSDLSVVSEHIHYNFERVNDLKSNVSSKIELEQNNIFKTLTIITVALALPTLIAGVYGMNFKYMPELEYRFAYPLVVIIIVLSCLLPLIYFKRIKWF